MKSKRLQALSTLVDSNKDIIDVGCEGALLDIYLAATKYVSVLGIDINDNSLKVAKKNVIAAHLEDKIKIIKNNGLAGIDYDNKVVIIAGLGTRNILKIVRNHQLQEVIILTHNDPLLLRKEMCKKYTIKEELIVKENNKYYVIIKFIKGFRRYSNIEKTLGPIIVKRRDDKDMIYLNNLYLIQKSMYHKIPNYFIIKKFKKRLLIRKIELYLK